MLNTDAMITSDHRSCWTSETGHQIGHHTQVILYSVQCCCAVHWIDKKSVQLQHLCFTQS